MSEFKKVTKEEFDEFVNSYPNKLHWNVTGICEPAMGSHNDFSNGKIWPESMVTKVTLTNGEAYYDYEPNSYYIKEIK